MNFCIKSPIELTPEEIDTINQFREKEFNAKKPLDVSKDDHDTKYFLLKDNGSIRAFGIARPLHINFRKKDHEVLEFISVVATEKLKGYGSAIMKSIKEYAKEQGVTLIGFCSSDLILFYISNNFETMENGVDRFAFEPDEYSFEGETPGMPVYTSGEDGLIIDMAESIEEVAYIKRLKN